MEALGSQRLGFPVIFQALSLQESVTHMTQGISVGTLRDDTYSGHEACGLHGWEVRALSSGSKDYDFGLDPASYWLMTFVVIVQSSLTLCNPMDTSQGACQTPLCFTVSWKWSESRSVVSYSLLPHGLYSPWNSPGQNTGAFPFFRGSSQPRNQTQVSCIADGFFTSWGTRKDQEY